MTVETATYIADLNATYPAAGDLKSEGDDHLRLLKSTIKATFPNFASAAAGIYTDTGGNVGVGIAPVAKFHTNGAGHEHRLQGSSAFISGYNTAGAQRNGYLQFQDAAVSLTAEGAGGTSYIVFGAGGGEKLRITSDGRLYGTALHNNAGSVTGTATQYVASGTWTPTVSNTVNVASSTARLGQWLRVGNVVHASVYVSVTVTSASTVSAFDITLPIASTFTTNFQLCGTVQTYNATTSPDVGRMSSDTSNNKAQVNWVSDAGAPAPYEYALVFTYEVR